MNYKYFICDVDGVIIDRMSINKNAFVKRTKKFMIPEKASKKYYYNTAGKPLKDQFKEIFEEFGVNYSDELLDDLKKDFFSEVEKKNPNIFKNSANVIEKIRKKGLKILYTSGSNTKDIKNQFDNNNIYYDLILGSDKVEKSNKHIQKMADFLNIDRSKFSKRSIYLGDGPMDIKIAKEFNIFMVAITNTLDRTSLKNLKPDKIINDIGEVLKYI